MAVEAAPGRAGKRRRGTRATPAVRRFGYVLAIVLNLVFLYLIHRQPGWGSVPVLTDDTTRVLPYVDASIIASIVVNAVFLVLDPRPVKALGDLTTSAFSLVAMVRIWQVWPFDFSGVSDGWRWLVYVGLGVGTFGVAVGIIAASVAFVRSLGGTGPRAGASSASS